MSFFEELKRRNVIKVAIAYAILAWLMAQVADLLLETFGAPEWVFKTLLMFFLIGFPFALFFAWAFEMTPDGIKKEKDVDRSQSITKNTGRKLNHTIIGILVLVAVYFIWESRFQTDRAEPETLNTTVTNASEPVLEEATAVRANSIAVLPFANRSNVQDDLFFTDGIHDDLLTQLAKISGLKVTSRTSVMEYRDTTKKIREIAAELGVSSILEGGIQRAGNRIRINAQLIDVNTDEHLWAETFDREMTIENIFDIQSEITRQIVTAIRGELTTEEADVLTQLPTHSLEAYEAYLHARTLLNSADYTTQKFVDAESWLEKAVELDPEFALAWALLVGTNAQGIWQGYDDSAERLQRVREALSKATEFGPFLPETLVARAEYLYRIENNYHEAEVAFRAVRQAQPGDATSAKRLAYTLRRTGKWEQAISNFQLAFELDPEDISSRTEMINTLMEMREYDRAEPLINAWIERYPEAMDLKGYKLWLAVLRDGDLAAARNLFDQLEPNGGSPYFDAVSFLPMLERNYQAVIDNYDNPQISVFVNDPASQLFALVSKIVAYRLMGESNQARAMAQYAIKAFLEALSSSSGSDANKSTILVGLAISYVQSGEIAKALEAINQARTLTPESRDSLNGTQISQLHPWILALSGEREEALSEINRLLTVPAGLTRWGLYLDPQWDFFRDDERFNELIRPLNLEN